MHNIQDIQAKIRRCVTRCYTLVNTHRFYWTVGVIFVLVILGVWIRDKQKTPEGATPSTAIRQQSSLKRLRSFVEGTASVRLQYPRLDNRLMEPLSFFEKEGNGEGAWQSVPQLPVVYDRVNPHQGKTSLLLSSSNRQPMRVFLKKKVDLSAYEWFEFFVRTSDPSAIESLTVKFGDAAMENYYTHVIVNPQTNWTVVRVPMQYLIPTIRRQEFNLAGVERMEFELIARPGTSAEVNVDSFILLKDLEFLKDWQLGRAESLVLFKNDDAVFLGMRNIGSAVATLKEAGGAKDFTLTTSVIPLSSGVQSGLFFRGDYLNGQGYYFMINGAGGREWVLSKSGREGSKIIASGEFADLVFEPTKRYWLRVKTDGKRILGFMSLDGKHYTKVVEAEDEEFEGGGLGIVNTGAGLALFDEVVLER